MSSRHVRRVNGPVVEVDGLESAMLELVEVGEARLPGEVIALDGPVATVQVYAYTGGVRPGDPVVSTGHPLRAELGPGLLGGVFDGMLRRLCGAGEIAARRGLGATLDRDRRWQFTPSAPPAKRSGGRRSSARCPRPRRSRSALIVPPGASGAPRVDRPAGRVHGVDPVARVDGDR